MNEAPMKIEPTANGLPLHKQPVGTLVHGVRGVVIAWRCVGNTRINLHLGAYYSGGLIQSTWRDQQVGALHPDVWAYGANPVDYKNEGFDRLATREEALEFLDRFPCFLEMAIIPEPEDVLVTWWDSL